MGLLRLFLALSVVFAHTVPTFGPTLMPGDVAVKLFFIISGFYMALILSRKYAGSDRLWTFYSNRVLRLYPTFLFGVVLMVALHLGGGGAATSETLFIHELTGARDTLSGFETALFSIPNLFIVGSDLAFLFHHGQEGWEFTFGAAASDPSAFRASAYLLMPPMWSVGIELWFYALVPFLVRARWPVLGGLAAASVLLRLGMDYVMPWSSYFFFPTALCFFLCGMLAYRFYASAMFASVSTPGRAKVITLLGLAYLMLREFVPGFRNYPIFSYAVLSCMLPFAFQATKGLSIDRWIGNLSYPVYVFHSAVILFWLNRIGPTGPATYWICATTISLAAMFNLLFDAPLEAFRQKRIDRITAQRAAAMTEPSAF